MWNLCYPRQQVMFTAEVDNETEDDDDEENECSSCGWLMDPGRPYWDAVTTTSKNAQD